MIDQFPLLPTFFFLFLVMLCLCLSLSLSLQECLEALVKDAIPDIFPAKEGGALYAGRAF